MTDPELKALLRRYVEEDTYSFADFDELEVNSVGREQESVLHMICRRDATEEAKLLILHGANVNAQTDIGTTPLHCAAMNCNIELAQFLLEHGALPDTQSQFGGTAKSLADKAGCGMEFENLLQKFSNS
jgi:ankyrin repeat protein